MRAFLDKVYGPPRQNEQQFAHVQAPPMEVVQHPYSTAARWDIGARAAVRHSFRSSVVRHLAGVSVGHNLMGDIWLSLSYNVTGFIDDDFAGADYTARDPYLKLRMKVDQERLKEFLSFAGSDNQRSR
ncbi:MAG: hypothetical protein QF515_06605 [Pseudomonadales bacterium]|jgi:hypothetical protein|nr:hypothetical protein [Pseudomonadales bacterium]MDP6471960.1 hypothetical protein [Pseudomonadales bacterium]MDP6826769.1 hypothetical protein [Pseudomonadales bacterium]|tara:strand:- start:2035 stop:2418 length:384 start_codon:yes stop_codon:yes gene_type:complete